MQILTSTAAENITMPSKLHDDSPYAYWGAEFGSARYLLASAAVVSGRRFETLFADFATEAAANLDDHHIVVSGETYVPAGILTDLVSDFLTWAQNEGLLVVTPKGIANACFGN